MQTHASTHFAWDARKASFVWALTLQRAQSRSAPSWSGSEHVQGLSAQVSKSLLAPFLQIGTLRRRVAQRIVELRELTDAAAAGDVPEACALAAALESVMDWLGADIDARPPPLSLFVAGRGLEDALAVLKSVADVLGCVSGQLVLCCASPLTLSTGPQSPHSVPASAAARRKRRSTKQCQRPAADARLSRASGAALLVRLAAAGRGAEPAARGDQRSVAHRRRGVDWLAWRQAKGRKHRRRKGQVAGLGRR
jgi:hypothetical protein